MKRYLTAVRILEAVLSQDEMETINDALHCYGRHPECHTYDEEMDHIRGLAQAFDERGFNCLYPQYDILKLQEPPLNG